MKNIPFFSKVKREFSPKELEVLVFICKGHTTAEIAVKMGSSVKTIESYRRTLLSKSKSRNVAQLVFYTCHEKILEKNSI